jgi:hypothetical protein
VFEGSSTGRIEAWLPLLILSSLSDVAIVSSVYRKSLNVTQTPRAPSAHLYERVDLTDLLRSPLGPSRPYHLAPRCACEQHLAPLTQEADTLIPFRPDYRPVSAIIEGYVRFLGVSKHLLSESSSSLCSNLGSLPSQFSSLN